MSGIYTSSYLHATYMAATPTNCKYFLPTFGTAFKKEKNKEKKIENECKTIQVNDNSFKTYLKIPIKNLHSKVKCFL